MYKLTIVVTINGEDLHAGCELPIDLTEQHRNHLIFSYLSILAHYHNLVFINTLTLMDEMGNPIPMTYEEQFNNPIDNPIDENEEKVP